MVDVSANLGYTKGTFCLVVNIEEDITNRVVSFLLTENSGTYILVLSGDSAKDHF